MPRSRSIEVHLSPDSLNALQAGSYHLVLFRGTASPHRDLMSTVVMRKRAQELRESNSIICKDEFYSFVSNKELRHANKLEAIHAKAAVLGDELQVAEDNASVSMVSGDESTETQFLNFCNSGEAAVCGYAMTHPELDAPALCCAVNIPGKAKGSLTPLNRYMLLFTNDSIFAHNNCIHHIENNAAIVQFDADTEKRQTCFDFASGYWYQGTKVREQVRTSNGWLNNVWDSVKKGGNAALNEVLNNGG